MTSPVTLWGHSKPADAPTIHPEHPSLGHPADALLDSMEGVGTLDLVAEGFAPQPGRCGAPIAIWSVSEGGKIRFCDRPPHLHDMPELRSHDHTTDHKGNQVRVPARKPGESGRS